MAEVAVLRDEANEQSRGFWIDAWRRLRRNRVAVIGAAIILLNILVAIFADFVAPYSYREQNHLAFRSAPGWVIDLFPQMKEIDRDIWYFDGQEGDTVTIRMESEDFNPLVILRGPDDERLREGKPIIGTVGQPSPGDEITRFALPETATYSVVAAREQLNEVGAYLLSIETQAASSNDARLECTADSDGGTRECGDIGYGEVATGSIDGKGYVIRNEN